MVKNTRNLWYSVIMFGVAFDLGTTSLVAYLCSITDKKIIKTVSRLNPQIKYGADIISRITFMFEKEGNRDILTKILGDEILSMVEEVACIDGDIKITELDSLMLVGNPVIMGTVADYDFSEGLKRYSSGEKSTIVLGLPMIGKYAGADALSGAYMLEKERDGKNIILMDIGTNGEIVLLTDEKKVATSAAAGPALEGGNITFGMRGEEGAIDRIELTRTVSGAEDIIIHVIGEGKARGLCGSGLLSLLQRMIEANVVDNTGYMYSRSEAIANGCSVKIAGRIVDDNMRYFRLTDSITVSQDDIRALQLAISALRTGAEMLIKENSLTDEVIDNIYIAGAFGNKISIESAMAVGMLPRIGIEKVVQAGNLAGIGACHLLMNQEEIADAIKLNSSILTVSLSEKEEFRDEFMRYMPFNI